MIMLPHKGLYIGDRIATWMLYVSALILLIGLLNHVYSRGGTIPPKTGIVNRDSSEIEPISY